MEQKKYKIVYKVDGKIVEKIVNTQKEVFERLEKNDGFYISILDENT